MKNKLRNLRKDWFILKENIHQDVSRIHRVMNGIEQEDERHRGGLVLARTELMMAIDNLFKHLKRLEKKLLKDKRKDD